MLGGIVPKRHLVLEDLCQTEEEETENHERQKL